MVSKGALQHRSGQILAILVAALFLFVLVDCGGGGGGGSNNTTNDSHVTITGVVDDGGGNSPVLDASCSFIDSGGETRDTDICERDGSFELSVPPGVRGYIYCGPRSMPNLNLTTFSSTEGYTGGQPKDNENVTPTTTVVADILRYENPPNPEARKAELILRAENSPNLTIVVAMAGRLYRAMLAQRVDARFGDDRSGGDGGGDGGRGDGGGAGGDAGDGADFSPLPGARCTFVVGDDLGSAEGISPAALADFLADGELDRPDLAALATTVSEGLSYGPDEIRQAFEAWFPQGLGGTLSTLTNERGEYFLPIPANLAGYVRCKPRNREKLVLGTYIPGRENGEVLGDEDVNPATTVFSALIASQLQGNLADAWDNYLGDIDGLDVRLEGPNLPAGPVTGIKLNPGTAPNDKDVGLVAFSVTALFNALLKDDLDVDFLAAIDDLVANSSVTPAFLESQGVPSAEAQALVDVLNPAIDATEAELGATLGAALSKARVNVRVTNAADDSPIAGAAVVLGESAVTCAAGCDQTTDAQGALTLTLSDVPQTATQIELRVSAEPDFPAVSVTTTVAAFATVDVTVRLSGTNTGQGTVSGGVVDAVDDAPLEGVSVSVFDGNQEVATTTTDSQGNYSLQCAPASAYTLTYEIDGYLPTRYGNVTVSAGETTFLETALQVSATYSGDGDIAGTIRNALNNDSIAGVSLQLREGLNSLSGSVVATATTDANGGYGFTAVPAGAYTVSASHDDYQDLNFTVLSVGGQVRDAQDASMSPALGAGEIRIVLSWGAEPSDLDSHLTGPSSSGGSFHCYYGSRTPDPGYVNLDRDDTSSYGPETTTIEQRLAGTYQFQVYDYSNRSSTTSSVLSNSGAQVKVYDDSGEIASYNVPSGQGGTVWTVFDLDGASGRITPRNTMTYSASSAAARYIQAEK